MGGIMEHKYTVVGNHKQSTNNCKYDRVRNLNEEDSLKMEAEWKKRQ